MLLNDNNENQLIRIYSSLQVKKADAYTMANEPITSIDLMERAANVFTDWLGQLYPEKSSVFLVFCGPGNNGGDGLAVARLLLQSGYAMVTVLHCLISPNTSDDFSINLNRLDEINFPGLSKRTIDQGDPFPEIPEKAVVIDAIFGSGLSRPLKGYWAELVRWINGHQNEIVSIDMPSGMFMDKATELAIRANHCLSFEFPRLAFFMPENEQFLQNWEVRTIGLSAKYIAETPSDYSLLTAKKVRSLYRSRKKFSHKGTYGHGLLICGSYGMAGAAVLAGKAALRSGIGLLSLHIPGKLYDIIQVSVPEAIVDVDENGRCFTGVHSVKQFDAIGIGCGLGKEKPTRKALKKLLVTYRGPLVLDADGLNILAGDLELLDHVSENSVLTPHPGEFDRLFGQSSDHFERIEKARKAARERKLFIVLKGAYTAIITPGGKVIFNCTGNAGMATGGSGDVLTGMLTGILAQGYDPMDVVILAVYLHGLAGDLAVRVFGQEALVAGDIIQYTGDAWKSIQHD